MGAGGGGEVNKLAFGSKIDEKQVCTLNMAIEHGGDYWPSHPWLCEWMNFL